MKVDEFVIKRADRNVREFVDQATIIFNYGKYSAQVVTTPPQWVARNGEFVFFQSSTSSGNRVYFYALNQWNWMAGSPSGGGTPDATFVTLSTNDNLTQERVLTQSSNIIIVDNGSNSTVQIAVNPPGSNAMVIWNSSNVLGADSGFLYVANSAVLVGTGTSLVFNANSGSNTRMVYTISNTYLEFYLNGSIRLQM